MMDMVGVRLMALTICAVIGLVPVMLSYLNPDTSRRKWMYTTAWAAFWCFPAFLSLYRVAITP